MQVYAIELGKDLGLTEEERHALQAASLLHDIGKLAVPEHIISKPGRLTPGRVRKDEDPSRSWARRFWSA